MQKYLFVHKGFFKILELENNEEARHWVINHLDQSLDPYIFKVAFENENTFSLSGDNLFNLNAKKFFELLGTGEGTLIFKKELK